MGVPAAAGLLVRPLLALGHQIKKQKGEAARWSGLFAF
jgi:hypothetical protein